MGGDKEVLITISVDDVNEKFVFKYKIGERVDFKFFNYMELLPEENDDATVVIDNSYTVEKNIHIEMLEEESVLSNGEDEAEIFEEDTEEVDSDEMGDDVYRPVSDMKISHNYFIWRVVIVQT